MTQDRRRTWRKNEDRGDRLLSPPDLVSHDHTCEWHWQVITPVSGRWSHLCIICVAALISWFVFGTLYSNKNRQISHKFAQIEYD